MDEKTKQILAYVFGPIGGLIFFLLKDSSEETKYHSAQSLVIGGLALILSFVPLFSYFVGIVWVVFIVLGIIRVVNEEDPKLPGISNLVDMLFAKEFKKEQTGGTKNVDAEVKDVDKE